MMLCRRLDAIAEDKVSTERLWTEGRGTDRPIRRVITAVLSPEHRPVMLDALIQRRWVRWSLIVGFWTVVGLFFTLQAVLTYVSRGETARWGPALIYQMSIWYTWGVLTPLILSLARRYRPAQHQWARSVGMLVLAGLVIAPFQVVVATAVRSGALMGAGILSAEQAQHLVTSVMGLGVLTSSFDGFITYGLIVGVFYTFDYYRKYRERELRTSQLEGQLAQAQLQNLKMQLHPHFLFNTLNSISALISVEPEAAERMIARLSDLLRLTLEHAGTQKVTLRQELSFLEQYLEIEQTRFQDRLSVTMDVAPETLEARVPTLILQPLVENAIRHGVAPRATPGEVHIRAGRSNGLLELQVRDDGPGVPDERHVREGIGLNNTRRRLDQLYGDRHRFELRNGADGGLEVRLAVPFRTTDPESTDGSTP